MRLGRDPIRRLMLVSLAVVLFVGLGYGVSWVDESLPWLRALVQLAQIGFLVLAFNQLLPARGLVAQLMRGFLVVCGLLFVFSLDLYGVTGYRFFLTWDESMAVWSGWLIGLALLSWLPVRWMTVRGVSQRGWQTEWFAWTSSLLAVGILYAVTLIVPDWISATWADIVKAKPDFMFVYAPLRAVLGLTYCLLTLVYLRSLPRLLPRRRFLWIVQLLVGVFLMAIPVLISVEAVPMVIRRFAADLSRQWQAASLVGRILFVSSMLGMFSRHPRSRPVNAIPGAFGSLEDGS